MQTRIALKLASIAVGIGYDRWSSTRRNRVARAVEIEKENLLLRSALGTSTAQVTYLLDVLILNEVVPTEFDLIVLNTLVFE